MWNDTPSHKLREILLSVSLQYLCVAINDQSRDVAIAAKNLW